MPFRDVWTFLCNIDSLGKCPLTCAYLIEVDYIV